MGFKTHKQMGEALLRVKVPTMERVVLLDMALAVEDGSLVYSWGHDRLALAIGKEPGSIAAKSALSQRIIPSLIRKRLIDKTSEAHRGHHAEYVLSMLSDRGMGNGLDAERATASTGMGSGFEAERVAVSTGMGSAQTATPLPTHYQSTDSHNSASTRWSLTDAQRRNVTDALSAIAQRSEGIDVMTFRDRELAYLDSLTFEERHERIGTWAGLRSRATNDGDEDLVEDERLHDLLEVHGFVYVSGDYWPTRVPGEPDAWIDHREESA